MIINHRHNLVIVASTRLRVVTAFQAIDGACTRASKFGRLGLLGLFGALLSLGKHACHRQFCRPQRQPPNYQRHLSTSQLFSTTTTTHTTLMTAAKSQDPVNYQEKIIVANCDIIEIQGWEPLRDTEGPVACDGCYKRLRAQTTTEEPLFADCVYIQDPKTTDSERPRSSMNRQDRLRQ
jgi:hypothetical protein